ncbi:MAG: hypothetical protein AB8B94_18995 [Hyphomicrobiales bacterium]
MYTLSSKHHSGQKWAIASLAAVLAVVMISVSPSPMQAKSLEMESTKIPLKLQRIVRSQRQSPKFMSQARGSGDEIDECMKNPDNSHIEYTERLAGCFCLAIDNALKGCQTAD